MTVQIGAKPDSGFDDPLGMLKDCHRRVERFLHILWVVASQAHGRALTDEEIAAVQASLQYFRLGGKRHTADEEESLFPRLRAVSSAGSFEELDRLESDHQDANAIHETTETLYAEWIADGRLTPDAELKLRSATERLKHLYEEHIQIEEQIIYPRAAQMLDRQAIAAIGQELRARRA